MKYSDHLAKGHPSNPSHHVHNHTETSCRKFSSAKPTLEDKSSKLSQFRKKLSFNFKFNPIDIDGDLEKKSKNNTSAKEREHLHQ
mmetsp:Transcript_13360/g.11860  ORF Transcript_13360/g.11860 Transcript_13360/m.11860 type:complete len:85 (-) Transcript_13360:4-258(-)